MGHSNSRPSLEGENLQEGFPASLGNVRGLDEILSNIACDSHLLGLPSWQPLMTRRQRCWRTFVTYSPLCVTLTIILFAIITYYSVPSLPDPKVDAHMAPSGRRLSRPRLLQSSLEHH